MKDEAITVLGLVALIIVVYAICAGVTVNGKHYGLVDCNDKQGIVIDVGATPDAGADGGAP